MKLSSEVLELYKQKVISIAKAFDSFCQQHDLNYFCIGGTAIGALRHNGMIPWDDDIDFVMPRPDYERFLKLSSKLLPNYDIFTHQNNKDYHLPYAKMCDANTTLLPSFRFKCVIGAFVDIFPIDGMPKGSQQERIKYFDNFLKLRKIASSINTYFTIRDFFSAIYRKDFIGIKSQVYSHIYHILHKKNDFFEKCDKYIAQNSYDNAEYVAYLGTNRGHNVISPKEYFESYFYHEFEDFALRLPIGIDKYLKKVYGDYMKFPPMKDRVLLHSYYYLDLNERITLDEILMRIKWDKTLSD